jgi:tetratricopeptide (TPR) repeat protein
MPETIGAYERVLAHEIPAADAASSTPASTSAHRCGLPFVGRGREFDLLTAGWRAASAGAGTTLLIAGEAGIGKSRLIDEFAAFADRNGGRLLRGGTTPFELAPYQAISEALRSALPMLREAQIEPLWLAVLATLVPQMYVAFPELRRLAALDAEPERTRLFEAVEIAMGALASARPTLIVLEDLHWAGSGTIALFEDLARHACAHRVLLVASYRAEDLLRAHPLRALRRRLERERLLRVIALGPLDATAIDEIVSHFTDDESQHRAAITEYLRDVSDGNPFFLGEIVANDREAGFLDESSRHWRRREALVASSPSLTSALNTRLERLSVRARSALEVGAVIGQSFSAELVSEVSGIDERSLLDSLGELIDRGLIREVDSGSADFAFSHQLIQQTVYAELPSDVRARRHRRVGEVMEELFGDQLEQFAAELASHFERGSEPERAAEYYCLAGRQALGMYGSEEAKTFASRARELTTDRATQFQATEIVEEAARRLADRALQSESIAQLLAIASELADPEMQREALRRRIVLAHDCGERERERAAIDELEPLIAGGRAPWAAVFAQLKGSYLTAIGSYPEARSVMSEALSDISMHDYPRIYVECRCALVELAGFEGRTSDVCEFLDEVPTFERDHEVSQAITLLQTACAVAIRIQDHTALAASADRLLDCSRAIAYRSGEAAAHYYAGRAALALFNVDHARTNLDKALHMFSEIGEPMKRFFALNSIADLMATTGHFSDAVEQFRAADSVALSISYGFGHFACLNNISYAANMGGDFALARSSALQALEAADQLAAPSARAHALVSLGIAERELNNIELAIRHLEDGIAIEKRLNESVALAEDLCELVIALLRGGHVDRAAEIVSELLIFAERPVQKLSHPQLVYWTVALVERARGKLSAARVALGQAHAILDEMESAIPDSDSRRTFRQARYNRAIDTAFERDHWTF